MSLSWFPIVSSQPPIIHLPHCIRVISPIWLHHSSAPIPHCLGWVTNYLIWHSRFFMPKPNLSFTKKIFSLWFPCLNHTIFCSKHTIYWPNFTFFFFLFLFFSLLPAPKINVASGCTFCFFLEKKKTGTDSRTGFQRPIWHRVLFLSCSV